MAFIIGIDTGGTYTDGVLIRTGCSPAKSVLKKAKCLTSHYDLTIGIKDCLMGLAGDDGFPCDIERVVVSTTLATNAIIESRLRRAGLLLIGKRPRGKLATEHFRIVGGSMNIKGRELGIPDESEIAQAAHSLAPNAEALAISGYMSTRNPAQEKRAKAIIQSKLDLPVVCGHELTDKLGFLERTNTAVMNAGLLPIIDAFAAAILNVVGLYRIKAPVFIVRGDGSLSGLDMIRERPIDTILSGPAASMNGGLLLSGEKDGIIADMGGTTTDIAYVANGQIGSTEHGAKIAGWQLRIKSADIHTCGLGGNSLIDSKCNDKSIAVSVGPQSTLPACRGGGDVITPTDIVHYNKDFVKWDSASSCKSVISRAKRLGVTADVCIAAMRSAVIKSIYREVVQPYRSVSDRVIAIGAPAKCWFVAAADMYGFELIVPEHYEVAGAVGAAFSGISETVRILVRPGEDEYGYLIHTPIERIYERDKETAVSIAVCIARKLAVRAAQTHGIHATLTDFSCDDIFSGEQKKYIETRVSATASAKLFFEDGKESE